MNPGPFYGVTPYWAAYQEVLGAKLSLKQRAVLGLALSFFTWRTLVREGGLEQGAAVGAMVNAIECTDGSKAVEDDTA